MKNQITGILTAASLVTSGSLAIAEGHNGNGQGFSTTVSSTTMAGTSGSIIHSIAEDFWNYENAPEGWPTAAMATCHFTIVVPDGDASVWTAAIDPSTGVGKGNLTSGTGKYTGVEAFPTFQTSFQLDAKHSIYDFKW